MTGKSCSISKSWKEALTDKSRIPYVRQSDDSQNTTEQKLVEAVRLGDKQLSPTTLKVYSALPKSRWLSWIELWRMNIPLDQTKSWHVLDGKMRNTADELSVNLLPATKDAVLDELKYGQNDALIVFAHSEYGRIYLSGLHGEVIDFEEIRAITRATSPSRATYLITCNAGSVNAELTSLAEILIKNNLTQTVFASNADVDARSIPAMLTDLLKPGNNPREVMNKFGFLQIVVRQIVTKTKVS